MDARPVTLDAIRAARTRLGDHVARTPLAKSQTLSAQLGADIYLKFENQQFTASFKERGALNRLLLLSDAERARGVTAMSAGNHAQALAYHGSRLGVPVSIVMPRHTPNAKVEQTRVFGAEVTLHGNQFAETLDFTKSLAQENGYTLIHPFDDEAVIAGQGTLGLELLEQAPDLDTIVVPVGGGGLIAGTALAAKALRPEVAIVGVQAERFSAAADIFNGRQPGPGTGRGRWRKASPSRPRASRPWRSFTRVRGSNGDRGRTDIEAAVFKLLEIEKTVTEGAGAAALAAVMVDRSLAMGKTALILTGGNIDMMILSSVLQRGLVRSKRLVRLAVESPDVPGTLAKLTGILGDLDSNIVDVVHQRAFGASSVRATRIEFVLQMRGEEQVEVVINTLKKAGYDAQLAP